MLRGTPYRSPPDGALHTYDAGKLSRVVRMLFHGFRAGPLDGLRGPPCIVSSRPVSDMLSLQRILVPTDLSPSAHRALDAAADLARRCDAELHILHVYPSAGAGPVFGFFYDLMGTTSPDAMRSHLADRIERETRERTTDLARVEHVHREGTHVAAEILAYADEVGADLIAMGTHGHRSLEHLTLGGTAGDVIRKADCPVLTIREGAVDELPDLSSLRHVLVPIDFSPHASEALRLARDVGALYEAELSLLFVAETRVVPIFQDTGLPALTTLQMDPEITDRAEEALRQLYEDVEAPSLPASFHVRHGHPAHEVLDFARSEDVDLVVMATHGQTRERRFLLGGVTERVVRKAPCPTLTLPAEGSSTSAP